MDAFSFDLFIYAFLAGVLVTLTHVPLGKTVLDRGIIFVDLAVAQLAALGVMIATGLHMEHWPVVEAISNALSINPAWITQVTAVLCALLGAVLLNWTEKRWTENQEAIIGIVFILAATGGMIFIDHLANPSEHIKSVLSGQIVYVDLKQIVICAIIYALVLMYWYLVPGKRRLQFYLLFAIVVTVSVQLVGLYLVFASLIIPAITMRYIKSYRLATGFVISLLGYASGILITFFIKMPTGPTIVWAIAIFAIIALMLFHKKAS